MENVSLKIKKLCNQYDFRGERMLLTPTAKYVRDLAKKEGISFNPIFVDQWALSVAKLVGDEVKSDLTDDLLVALTRSDKLSPNDMVALVIKHHLDLKHV